MIPILFESNAQTFTTQGLGALVDAAYCAARTVLNGEMELEIQYPVGGIHFSEIKHRRIVLAQPSPTADPQPYRIHEISKPMGGLITVYAHHISYDLTGYPVVPFTAPNVAAALQGLKTNAVQAHPFTFWTDKTTVADFRLTVPASTRAALGGVAGSILDTYGGEFDFDGFIVRLRNRLGEDRGVRIAYGVNLVDLQQDENIAKMYTGVYPFWANETQRIEADPKIVQAPGNYDFINVLMLDLSMEFTEPPTPEELTARTQKYIQDNDIGVPSVSLDVSFFPLEQTEEYKDRALLERVELGDTVTVEFPALEVNAQARVRETVYDVLLGRYISIHLGAMRATLSTTIAQQQKEIAGIPGAVLGQVNTESITMTDVEAAIKNATDLITGEMGGNVVIVRNAAGEPAEILIMDTPDITTATKVWRWNQSGLGCSSQGYNGPYTTAITQNGQIVADFITAGTLSGSMVTAANLTAGTIQSQDGQTFYLDLDNGILRGKFDSFSIGGKSVDEIADEEAASAAAAAKQEAIVAAAEDATQKANAAESAAISAAASDATSKANAALASAKTYADGLDNALTQREIFDRLTNNGQTQGIYLEGNKLYINASYIQAGMLSSADGETFVLNLDTGELTLDGSAGGGVTIKNAGISILKSQTYYASNYTSSDTTRAQNIMLGSISPTASDIKKYDFYGDGKITLQEILCIQQMVSTGKNLTVTWYAQLDTSKESIFKIWRTNSGVNTASQTLVNISAGGVELPEYARIEEAYNIYMPTENISENDDLNTYTTPGSYNCGSAAIASTLLNSPTTSTGFRLDIKEGYVKGRVIQTAYNNTGAIYQRYYNGSLWTDWGRTYTTTYQPTPDKIGAQKEYESHGVLSRAGWYTIFEASYDETVQALSNNGNVFEITIDRTYNTINNETHSIKLLQTYDSFQFLDELSKTNYRGIEKIRCMVDGLNMRIDIYYGLNYSNDLGCRFNVSNTIVGSFVPKVPYAASGSGRLMASYDFTTNTKSTVTVTANSAINLSLSDGEMAYLGYTTSSTSNADISLLVNGSGPETNSYTYAGTSNNYNANIFARSGSSRKGTFSGWIAVHGSTVEVWGSGRRGSDSGGNMGQTHMSWDLSSVSSITISAPGTLTITKLS